MMRHPAKFSQELLPLLAELVGDRRPVLDPMAGGGIIANVLGPAICANEIEPEWAEECKKRIWGGHVTTCDARNLPYPDGFFQAVVTSPTYGNRMADHHEAKDKCSKCWGTGDGMKWGARCAGCNGTGLSRRNTYTHTLGRKLTEGNTGAMQWGSEYRNVHADIWAECFRVLAPGGRFVLNVKDHIRKGTIVPVSAFHLSTCHDIGFVSNPILSEYMVECPGQRQGANGDLRVPYESVFVLEKP